MHLEIPKQKLHSLKEFASHYLMIVLSILTALGLEQWIEHAHHERAAETASRQIEAELANDLAETREARQTNAEDLKPLLELDKLITADVLAGTDSKTINEHIRAHSKQFDINIHWPIFASQAWDVAVANQSASWIPVDRLNSYSGAYADQRHATEWLSQDSTLLLSAPRMVDIRTKVELGRDVDPIEFITVLRQMIATVQGTQSHLEQLEPHMMAALGKHE
jgi:hypothetical protein